MTPAHGHPPATDDNHFAEVFAEALRRSNLPLREVHERLVAAGTPVSVTTLSYWQTGRSRPRRNSSLRVLAQLEEILELVPGTLVAAIEERSFARWDFLSVVPGRDATAEAMRELGLDKARNYSGVSSYDELVVGADRTEKSQLCHQLVRCDAGTLDRIPIVMQQDGELPGERAPDLSAVAGCRTGRVVKVPAERLVVGELLLPFTLHAGQVHNLVYRVDWAPSDVVAYRWERSAQNDHRQMVIQVLFEGTPPRHARRYYLEGAEQSPDEGWPPGGIPGVDVPVADAQLQAVFTDAPLGIHGVAWEW